MDRLRTLTAFSWNSVDAQATQIYEAVVAANHSGRSSIELQGRIHRINEYILTHNGFAVTQNDGHFLVEWTPFTTSTASPSCECNPCECGTSANDESIDNFLKLFMGLLSQLPSTSNGANKE